MTNKGTDTDYFKSLLLANEFLKLLHGLLHENQRENPLPIEVQESLGNEHLRSIMDKYNIDDPEMLVWGLVKIIEMLLVTNEISAEDLAGGIDNFIKFVESNPDLEPKEATDE